MSNASIRDFSCSIHIIANCYEAKNQHTVPFSKPSRCIFETAQPLCLSSKGTEMNTPLITSNNTHTHSIDPVKHGPLYTRPFFREIDGGLGVQCQSNVRQMKEILLTSFSQSTKTVRIHSGHCDI